MEIRNNTQKINFQANLIGKAVTRIGKKEIDIYKLNKNDEHFAQKMFKNIDLEKMYPDLISYDGFVDWQKYILDAVYSIGRADVILTVHNKRPCGILSSYDMGNSRSIVSRIATWPIKENTKVPFAGKTLMRALFQNLKDLNHDTLSLTPSFCRPLGKSCNEFYRDLGFKFIFDRESPTIRAILNNVNFGRKCAQLDNFMDYKKIEDSPEVDLNKQLCLEFKDTLYEKIKQFTTNLTHKYSGNSSRHITG